MIKRRNFKKNIYLDNQSVELVSQLELIGKEKTSLIKNITVENLKVNLAGKSYFNCVFKKCEILGYAEIIEECYFFDCTIVINKGLFKNCQFELEIK